MNSSETLPDPGLMLSSLKLQATNNAYQILMFIFYWFHMLLLSPYWKTKTYGNYKAGKPFLKTWVQTKVMLVCPFAEDILK